MKGTIDIEKKVMEVIRQMTGGNGVSIDYESFEGYEVPPRTQFAMLNKPAVSIKDGRMTFNMACVRIFKGIHHIVPMINRKTHRLAIIPCKEEEGSSVQWSRMKGEELVNKDITARDLFPDGLGRRLQIQDHGQTIQLRAWADLCLRFG